MSRRDGWVPGALDEIPEAMVITLLRADFGMRMIIRRSLTPLYVRSSGQQVRRTSDQTFYRCDDNSRRNSAECPCGQLCWRRGSQASRRSTAPMEFLAGDTPDRVAGTFFQDN